MSEWEQRNGYRVRVTGAPAQVQVWDYGCGDDHRFEISVDPCIPPFDVVCPCGAPAERVFSAAKIGTVWGLRPVSMAKSDPRPGPLTMDTRTLADGGSRNEWRKKRSAAWRDIDRAEWKAKT